MYSSVPSVPSVVLLFEYLSAWTGPHEIDQVDPVIRSIRMGLVC